MFWNENDDYSNACFWEESIWMHPITSDRADHRSGSIAGTSFTDWHPVAVALVMVWLEALFLAGGRTSGFKSNGPASMSATVTVVGSSRATVANLLTSKSRRLLHLHSVSSLWVTLVHYLKVGKMVRRHWLPSGTRVLSVAYCSVSLQSIDVGALLASTYHIWSLS